METAKAVLAMWRPALSHIAPLPTLCNENKAKCETDFHPVALCPTQSKERPMYSYYLSRLRNIFDRDISPHSHHSGAVMCLQTKWNIHVYIVHNGRG